jgi:predicted permease
MTRLRIFPWRLRTLGPHGHPGWLEDLTRDVRYGLRVFRHSPGFAAVAALTLALGIGANTAIFSLLHVLMWRDLPVQDPGSLVQFTFQYPGDPPMNRFSTQNYEQYRDGNDVFSDLIGTAPVPLDSEGTGTGPLNTEWVTPNFFTALGLRPALGRLPGPPDAVPGAAPVAVVSWTYWRDRFHLDPRVLEARIPVADVTAQVVGVAAKDFSGLLTGYGTDVWIPAAAAHPTSRQAAGFMLMARLKEGVSIERARARMRVLDRPRIEELARKDPRWLEVVLEVEPARSGLSTPLHHQFGKPLVAVMAIAAVLLLLTCANIGSLVLARAAARQREMAVRMSLGASRLRIVQQALTESLLLSLAGSLFGVVGAYFGANGLARIMTSGRFFGPPPRLDVTIEASVLAFAAGAAVLAAVLFGLAPAWTALASHPASALKVAGGTAQPRARLFGNGLVVAQVAISLVVMTVAGLYVGHLSTLRNRGLGFDRRSVLLVKLDTARAAYDRKQLGRRFTVLLERFESLPGVRSATVSGTTPIHGAAASRFVTVHGFEDAPASRRRRMLNVVAPKYFETLGTPLLAGRDFQFADQGRAPVAIVNQALARHYFADRNPLGRHLLLERESRPYEIVGVVADAKYADLRSPAPQTVYLNAFQQNGLPSQFALRTDLPPATVASDVRRIVEDVLDGVSVARVTTLSDQVDASIVPERLLAALSGFFGGVGVLLAGMGLYGLLAHAVARRTNEIGVRIALGATRRDVTRIVVKEALALVCVGLVIGAPMALLGARIAASTLEGMFAESLGPGVLAGLVMIGVALLAAYVPARRATRVEPLIALRAE